MITIGIDPGLSGALAFIGANGGVVIEDMPTRAVSDAGMVRSRVDGLGLAQMARRHCPAGEPVNVFCESVGAWGSVDNAIQTQASLLGTLRAIEAVFDVLRRPVQLVTPNDWQTFYGLRGKKNESRERGALPAAIVTAVRLYADAAPLLARVKDHNKAEALLIAHYGQRKLA